MPSLLFLLLVAAHAQQCASPGQSPPEVCAPPSSRYSAVVDIPGRHQWLNRDGYCGANSIQMIALSYGIYASQDLVRKANGNHEVLHINTVATIEGLKLVAEAWDSDNYPEVQWKSFFKWLKSKLASRHPVVTYVLCKGDGHEFGYDHIEPFFALYSNHTLNETTWFPEDVVAHHSDWDQNTYYRTLGSLQDGLRMDGNCAIAPRHHGHNEMFPCINAEGKDHGFAITGVQDKQGVAKPIHLYVDEWQEPDLLDHKTPVAMKATLVISSLVPGTSYDLYRWDDKNECPGCLGGKFVPSMPLDSTLYPASTYTSRRVINATAESLTFHDPMPIMSDGATYYRCVPVV